MSNLPIKRIPYAVADYRTMRRDNGYYVDKTHFIPLLEAAPYYLFCIRPRRFGKTLWLSTLRHYYDVNLQDEFTDLFGGTYIGEHPTAERNSYLILFLNFALVNPDVRFVQESFENNGNTEIESFLRRYARFFEPEEHEKILAHEKTEDRLRQIFHYANEKKLKIYFFIDEYDNFANTILTTAGQQAYHNLTHGEGFFRFFFNLLKGGTGGQMAGLTRLFITGVSPITMDDVTSGFNIGTNISLEARFNEMIGFTEAEVRTMLTYYHANGVLLLEIEATLGLMKEWYNHYCFSTRAATDLFNSDMVLYFLERVREAPELPEYMIDENVRIDYTKLRHLITIDKHLNGNFSELKAIIESGETIAPLSLSFPLSRLLDRNNFISLLHYFGLLTIAGVQEGRPLLRIPNRTIKDLMYSYIRNSFQDVDVFRLDLWKLGNLLGDMAYRGNWQALFAFLGDEIKAQTSVRDYLNGEKVIQGFLLSYLNLTQFFLLWSEKEMGGGFVDFYMEPFLARYPDMRYGYLIELEYISRNDFNDTRLKQEIAEAEDQLKRYANDPRIQKVAAQVPLKKLVLVFSGWELVYSAEC
ncbi:MAG: AAA family ATPase [Caldilineaceae bacterium]